MKIINALVAYIMYFFAPKALMKKSFIGTLLHFNIRLPDQATDEIIEYIYDVYDKNQKIDKIMRRGRMTTNMERMWGLVQYEAFFIKDIINNNHVNVLGREAVLDILKKYQIHNGGEKDPVNTQTLHFKDNDAAWEIAEKYFHVGVDDTLVAEHKYLARLLEDYDGLNHRGDEVAISTTGVNSFCVALLPKNHPQRYPKGTLVFYTPIYLLDEYESIPNIWMGVINAIVAPELNPEKGWKIIEQFTDD